MNLRLMKKPLVQRPKTGGKGKNQKNEEKSKQNQIVGQGRIREARSQSDEKDQTTLNILRRKRVTRRIGSKDVIDGGGWMNDDAHRNAKRSSPESLDVVIMQKCVHPR